jgi:hypothetical protein
MILVKKLVQTGWLAYFSGLTQHVWILDTEHDQSLGIIQPEGWNDKAEINNKRNPGLKNYKHANKLRSEKLLQGHYIPKIS